jgi:hypothetical protein
MTFRTPIWTISFGVWPQIDPDAHFPGFGPWPAIRPWDDHFLTLTRFFDPNPGFWQNSEKWQSGWKNDLGVEILGITTFRVVTNFVNASQVFTTTRWCHDATKKIPVLVKTFANTLTKILTPRRFFSTPSCKNFRATTKICVRVKTFANTLTKILTVPQLFFVTTELL